MTKTLKNLKKILLQTPLAYAPVLSELSKNNVYIKRENQQLTSSFKIRGAFNKISTLTKEQLKNGVICVSAGNHAAGVAYSANYFKTKAIIVMPKHTPLSKINNVEKYNQTIILRGENYDQAAQYAYNLCKEKNLTFIHPYNDKEVIKGQGTIAEEVLEEIDKLDVIIVPIGGGGLITGIAKYVKKHSPKTKVIGVVSENCNEMYIKFNNIKKTPTKINSIADGINVQKTTPQMLKQIKKYVDEIHQVSDEQIASSILFMLENQKLLIEGASAVGIAFLLSGKINIKNKNVVIPLTGGNIDVSTLSTIIEKGLVNSNRKVNLKIKLKDIPGALQEVTKIFTSIDTNIVSIDYERNNAQLKYNEAIIKVSLEVKNLKHKEEVISSLKNKNYEISEF